MTDLLRLPAVQARTGLSRSEVYRRLAAGTLPTPITISGTRLKAWPSDEIDAWVQSQIAASRGTEPKESNRAVS